MNHYIVNTDACTTISEAIVEEEGRLKGPTGQSEAMATYHLSNGTAAQES